MPDAFPLAARRARAACWRALCHGIAGVRCCGEGARARSAARLELCSDSSSQNLCFPSPPAAFPGLGSFSADSTLHPDPEMSPLGARLCGIGEDVEALAGQLPGVLLRFKLLAGKVV